MHSGTMPTDTGGSPTHDGADILNENAINPWSEPLATLSNASTSGDHTELPFPGSYTDPNSDNHQYHTLERGSGDMRRKERRGRDRSSPKPDGIPQGSQWPSSSSSMHPFGSYHNMNNGRMERTDVSARNALRDIIFHTIMADHLSTMERACLLEEYKASAGENQTGLPFKNIISEPMEPFGIPPLMYELMGCKPDWEALQTGDEDHGLEVVLFLIKHWTENVISHGKLGNLEYVVRVACLRRLDDDEGNRLFQHLRSPMYESRFDGVQLFDYDICVTHATQHSANSASRVDYTGFTAIISLPNFKAQFAQVCSVQSETLAAKKKPSQTRAAIVTEFLATERAWALQIQNNALTLELLHGTTETEASNPHEKGATICVDARVNVISLYIAGTSAEKDGAIQLLFPPSLMKLENIPGPGSRAITLKPCFAPGIGSAQTPRGFDDYRVLNDDFLLLELTVRLSDMASRASVGELYAQPGSIVPAPQMSSVMSTGGCLSGPSGREVMNADKPDEIDDMYFDDDSDARSTSLLLKDDSDGWEEISQIDETEDKDGGWVKAGWSDKDEEL